MRTADQERFVSASESGLVSVVIPTRDRPRLLAEALGSALAQTWRDIEVLVVDDGSRPEARPVVERFDDRRVTYIRNDAPRGGAAARNRGIRASRGEYVAFLDDDDIWLPTKIEKQMAVFGRAPPEVGVVYCGNFVTDGKGSTLGVDHPSMRGDVAATLWGGTVVPSIRASWCAGVRS